MPAKYLAERCVRPDSHSRERRGRCSDVREPRDCSPRTGGREGPSPLRLRAVGSSQGGREEWARHPEAGRARPQEEGGSGSDAGEESQGECRGAGVCA